MRILQIIDVRWWNACAYYAIELSRALANHGHDILVAGGPSAPPIQRALARGLEVWTHPGFDEQRPWRAAAFLPRLVAELGRRRIEVVVAHRAPGHSLAALAAACRGGPPVVRTRGDIRPPRRHAGNRFLHHRLTAANVVPSRLMQRRLVEEFGLPASLVHVVPAGIDVERHVDRPVLREAAAALRIGLGVPEQAPCLAIVARLSPIKGHMVVLEALARLDLEPAPHLLVAGQEEEVPARDLIARAAALGMAQRVHLLGRQADVRPVLAAADLLLVPSLGSEAICRVLLEGMAVGLPAVASRVGVIGEVLVPERTGLLVPPGDADALAKACRSLLSPWPDSRPRLQAMGAVARQRAREEYDLPTWAERSARIYRAVMASRRTPAAHEPRARDT